jgi:hypothetical protein
MEASFDIVYEDHRSGVQLAAEVVLVAAQVVSMLPSPLPSPLKSLPRPPFWFIRLGHTKLADCILDLCGVPHKENTRRYCLSILGRFTAPTPAVLLPLVLPKKKVMLPQSEEKNEQLRLMAKEAEEHYDLPGHASTKLVLFIKNCSPLQPKPREAIGQIQNGISAMAHVDTRLDHRRIKRLEDAARNLKHVKDLVEELDSLGFGGFLGCVVDRQAESLTCPLLVSIDLGFQQRRRHYHGGTIFQCIVLPNDYFDNFDPKETVDSLLSSGGGIKLAEGGDFSELVRKHIPPGGFGNSSFEYYGSRPAPICFGVRIVIGKLIEHLYIDSLSGARLSVTDGSALTEGQSKGIDAVRRCLGHPFAYTNSVRCIVASDHGMDAASIPERFQVAARLWREGIPTEYLPQSGVMLSILRRLREDSDLGIAERCVTFSTHEILQKSN